MKYQDEESERSIIRTLLLNPGLVGNVIADLSEGDFVNPTYAKFYSTIESMFRAGEKIGLPEVCIRIGESQKITCDWVNSEYTSDLHLESYIQRVKELSATRKLKHKIETADDPHEIISMCKKVEAALETRKLKILDDVILQYEKNYNEKKKKGGKGIGIITGLKNFDEQICLEPTHLVCLAAKSSMGKSALALNLAVNAAMFEQKVLFFSAEMREDSLMDRVCAILTDTPIGRFKHANADASYNLAKIDLKKLKQYLKLQFFHSCTSDDICSLSRKESASGGIDLIVVDYLQYLSDKTAKGGTNNDRIGEITRKLKGLAGELKCCVLMLSQVNRKAEGMPELEHLRDSGNIEQDSDLVVMLHREDRQSSVAEIAVKKAREGEAELAIRLKFTPKTTKFTEL